MFTDDLDEAIYQARLAARRRDEHIRAEGAINALDVAEPRIRELEAKVAALEAENGRLKAPVTGEELVLLLGNGGSREEMATASWCRHFYDALIATRAQQPSPAQDKEQP